jgi:hypothetical protein
MSDVLIGVTGMIVSPADKHGWFVKVEDDSQNTGGYLILEWEDQGTGFDSWVENRAGVDRFFRECAWMMEWL